MYNLGHKHKHWIRNLSCEAESAIALLLPSEQEHMLYQVVRNIKKLQSQQYKQQAHTPAKTKEELKIVNQIKEKLNINKAIMAKKKKANLFNKLMLLTYIFLLF